MKRKQFIALALAGAMVLSTMVLASCGDSAKKKDVKAKTETTQSKDEAKVPELTDVKTAAIEAVKSTDLSKLTAEEKASVEKLIADYEAKINEAKDADAVEKLHTEYAAELKKLVGEKAKEDETKAAAASETAIASSTGTAIASSGGSSGTGYRGNGNYALKDDGQITDPPPGYGWGNSGSSGSSTGSSSNEPTGHYEKVWVDEDGYWEPGQRLDYIEIAGTKANGETFYELIGPDPSFENYTTCYDFMQGEGGWIDTNIGLCSYQWTQCDEYIPPKFIVTTPGHYEDVWVWD